MRPGIGGAARIIYKIFFVFVLHSFNIRVHLTLKCSRKIQNYSQQENIVENMSDNAQVINYLYL